MTADEVITILGYVITFVTGLGSGIIAEILHFKYLRKKDNWNDLKSPLQSVYAVVRNMCNDSDHAFRIQDNGSRLVIDTKLFRFMEITTAAERRLLEFSKAQIPHYMLFGKRKLKNWRTAQF